MPLRLATLRTAGRFLAALMGVVAAASARADCSLEPGERVHVASAIDGDTVVLADGSEVRLVGTQAPKLPLGRPGFEAWPLADEARAALEGLTAGRPAELRYGGARVDRHGRRLAHLFVEREGEELWVQGEMLDRGLARVYTFPDNRACADEMLALEREARAAGAGIWSDPFYALREATDTSGLEELEDTFQLVEGAVVDVAVVSRRVYLNFGQNYRQDFTITIDPRDTRHFADGGPEMRDLAGRRVRIRGWIALVNGPMIELTHPEQIELLDMVNSR